MSYFRYLLKAELVAVGWLIVCSALFALIVFAFVVPADSTSSFKDAAGQILFLMAAVFVFGLFPVLLFGAPIYALLRSRGSARWWSSLGVGLLPGIAMAPFEVPLAWYALAVGSAVALLTHISMRDGANNSFKPKPLRGSA